MILDAQIVFNRVLINRHSGLMNGVYPVKAEANLVWPS